MPITSLIRQSAMYRWGGYFALLMILLMAGYLRFTNLSDNPGWFTDEATHIDIAQHLSDGRVQYMAINQSTMLFARPPLFHIVLVGAFRLFGEGNATLRMLTAGLGVLSVVMLYALVQRIQGQKRDGLALLAALLLAMYPQAVLYSRFGFSYNLLTPFVLLTTLAVWEYAHSKHPRWLIVMSSIVGLGIISDLAMWVFAVPLLIVVIVIQKRDLPISIPLIVLPSVVYAGWMLMTVPDAFVFDLRFTLNRLGSIPLAQQLPEIARNYTTLISQDFWMLAGVIGLFLLRPMMFRWLSLLMFVLPLVIMGRTVALHGLSFYFMIPLLPFVALGTAGLIRYGVPHIIAAMREHPAPQVDARLQVVSVSLLLLVMIGAPLFITLNDTLDHVQDHWITGIEPFLIDADDARQVAGYINTNRDNNDMVITSAPVGWLLDARAADFQMAVAASGEAAVHLPSDIPADRFAFDARYQQARYIIIDNLWRNWGMVHIPGVVRMVRHAEAHWLLVFESGAIQVYQNPVS